MNYVTTVAAVFTLAATTLSPMDASAQTFTITDIFDRQVTFDRPIETVLLGDARFIYSIAPLQKENPFNKIAGWTRQFINGDASNWGAYVERFPEAANIPIISGLEHEQANNEGLVELRADVLLLPYDTREIAAEANVVDILDAVGTKVVFIDVQEYPLQNTTRSLEILGQIFDAEEEAAEFIAWREAQFARVDDVIAANPDIVRPVVFIDRFAQLPDACCNTYGPASYGELIAKAGGINLASEFVTTTEAAVSAEQILASRPEVYIATGTLLITPRPTVRLGAGADVEEARAALAGAIDRPAFAGAPAVADGRAHAIWHTFDTNPYDVVAYHAIAHWVQPDLFADLDPDETFRELHEKFLPVDYRPGYWVSLAGDVN